MTARAGFRATLGALSTAQKSPRGVSVYSSRVNRPAGRVLAAAAIVIGLGPTSVTLLSGLLSGIAVVVLAVATPSVGVGLAASMLLVIGFALDSADGQIARLRDASSRSGEWLDHTVDCAVKLMLPLAVVIAWYRADEPGGVLLVALAFQVVTVLLFFGGTLAGKLLARPTTDAAANGVRESRGLRPWLLLPVDHGVTAWAFVLWGWSPVFIACYSALLAAHSVYLVAFSTNWYRELS